MNGRQTASIGLLVAALLAYPFVDQALQAQTVYAVTDGMIYVLLALGLNNLPLRADWQSIWESMKSLKARKTSSPPFKTILCSKASRRTFTSASSLVHGD